MKRPNYWHAAPKWLFFATTWLFVAIQPAGAHQPHDAVLTLAASPNFLNDQTLFLATDYLSISIGVYLPMKSSDGGITWTPMKGLPNDPVSAIRFSAAYVKDGTAYIAGAGGLFRSTDHGDSWNFLGFSSGVADIALSPAFARDHTIFAVDVAGNLFRSTNRGDSWLALPTPAGLSSPIQVIALSPRYPLDRTILVGTGSDGIFESTTGSLSWSAVTQGMTLPAISALAFSPAFASDRTVFAGTEGAGILVSTDGGATWSASNNGLTDLEVTSIAITPAFARNSTLFVSTATAGVFASSTAGSIWALLSNVSRPLSDQTTVHYRTLAIAQQSSTTAVIYVGMFEGLWKSYSLGSSWQYVDILPTNLVREMQMSPSYEQDQTLFASTYGGGTLWTTDGGSSWEFRNAGLINAYPDALAFSPNYASDGTVFTGIVFGLQRSTDRGGVWLKMQMLGANAFPRALGISPGFAQDSTVIIGIDNLASGNPPTVTFEGTEYPNQGVFLSTDAGYTWVPTGLSGPRINSIAVSPAFTSDHTVFAGSSNSGLFKSVDGGMTWEPISIVASDTSVPQVAVSPSFDVDQTVFATTSHSGVFKSIDGGQSWTLLPGTDTINALDFAVSPDYAADGTLFIGTFQNSLLRSTDGGNSFHPTSLVDNFITAISVSPAFAVDQTVMAAGYRGIYRSTDGGTTWSFTGEPARQEERRDVTITYQGGWAETRTGAASSFFFVTSTEADAEVSLSFVGNGVRWIATTGPKMGSATVRVDGAVDSTVSLAAPSAQMQQAVWEKTGLPCTMHTLTLTSSAEPGQSAISLDAFDVLRDACIF